MYPDEIKAIIRETIEKTVNGKIDALRKAVDTHNERHEADYKDVKEHIEEVKPIIIDYKERVAAQAYAKKIGDGVKWTGGVLSALGIIGASILFILKTWSK